MLRVGYAACRRARPPWSRRSPAPATADRRGRACGRPRAASRPEASSTFHFRATGHDLRPLARRTRRRTCHRGWPRCILDEVVEQARRWRRRLVEARPVEDPGPRPSGARCKGRPLPLAGLAAVAQCGRSARPARRPGLGRTGRIGSPIRSARPGALHEPRPLRPGNQLVGDLGVVERRSGRPHSRRGGRGAGASSC